MNRIEKEKKTVTAMIGIYCRAEHGTARKQLCDDCRRLHDYSHERIDKCPFGLDKCACSECEIHCYKPAMREKIREVMAFSGPRMLFRHPILAIQHMFLKRTGSRER